jgi:branched-chain amino acid transport system permease protein
MTSTTTTPRGLETDRYAWREVFLAGLLFGGAALYVTLVGLVGTFEERDLISTGTESITLGQMVILLTAVGAGFVGAVRAPEGPVNALAGSAITGLMSGAALSILILLSEVIDLRRFMPNASPRLFDMLTLDQGVSGFWMPMLVGIGLGALGGLLKLLPRAARLLLAGTVGALIVMGLFAGHLRSAMLRQDALKELGRELMATDGLTLTGTILIIGLVLLVFIVHQLFRPLDRVRRLPPRVRRHPAVVLPLSGFLLLVVLLVPLGFVGFVPQVVALIALYVLMGLGLNITLGLAGLLDLGFVAFFAVGAYTVGLLTSTGEFGIAQWPFWAAIPFAILAAMLFGIVLGLPILGIRGDYLAIATLAFGEIIRLMVGSELLRPVLGGPSGFLNIPKPIEVEAGHPLAGPNSVYYVSLVCAAVIAFVAYRLKDSRLGRAWIAIREDEDVAEALGVNLVQTKSLAYMLGAAFAGLGGAVFASLAGSILPSAIRLDISIQVVSLIIIGGMGSIPGVIVGAIFLVGIPELFREFTQYRFLFYGIALILVMRFRPEGLMPSRVGRQEMHPEVPPAEGEPGSGGSAAIDDSSGADDEPRAADSASGA